MERVKFYSLNDITFGRNLRMCESLIKEHEAGKEAQDINDIIELYNVKKYFDKKIFLTNWAADDINHYEKIVKTFLGTVAKFFKAITNDSLITLYVDVDIFYKSDFWELIEKFNVYESIAEERFKEILYSTEVSLYELLKYKNITEHFGGIIREYMLEHTSSAEILLYKYELKHFREKDPIYFPKELSTFDKETIISNYIDSEDSNINYLSLIANIQSNKDKLEISPKTLLRAKRKVEVQEKQIFKENSGMVMETTVNFSKSQNEEATLTIEGQSITATYSTKWLEDNNDYPTLLNNFIYLFNFVDNQMRCTLVNKYNEMGVLERLFISSQNAYMKGIVFEQKNILSLLQIEGYYHQLFSIGIRLEEVVEWFFEEYLANELNAHNFKVTMPSANSTFLEKCTNIMPALESVLKQFSLFVQEGQIDFDLLEIRSEHLIYKNIPSLVKRKYVYGQGEEFNTATLLLFSDQSGLGYNEKVKRTYDTFFELVRNEKIKITDYPDYDTPKLNWLLDHKYLATDEKGNIIFNDVLLIMILKDLYFNEVISYWRYSESGRKIINKLKDKKVIIFESTLLSRPEQDYFNYTLNKSQFNNGLDLRNRYSHTQPKSSDDEKLHNQNYMIFLRLFIVSLIKINDDICTSAEISLLKKANV
ncbi:hypothetical protein NFG81_17035 [Bacillus paralicheniformis]|nr:MULTISPECIES: hypothetical protein [Bacillus]MCQ5457040.1 hypothetical protein [Bacillus paralicheniformis]